MNTANHIERGNHPTVLAILVVGVVAAGCIGGRIDTDARASSESPSAGASGPTPGSSEGGDESSSGPTSSVQNPTCQLPESVEADECTKAVETLCAARGQECGKTFAEVGCDGAVELIDCGGCPDGFTCSNGSCACPSDYECGSVASACGGTTSCGSCGPAETCTDDHTCACEEESETHLCERLGHACGEVTDEGLCGTTVDADCGGCTSGICSENGCHDELVLTPENPPDGGDEARLGYALAAAGETIVAGSPYRDVDGTENAGVAHVFERATDGSWETAATWTAKAPVEEGHFASEIAATESTVFLTIDARSGGRGTAIAVFERGSDGWSRSHTIEPTPAAQGAEFGSFLGVTPEGALLVGSPPGGDGTNAGRVEIFRTEGGEWTKSATVEPPSGLSSSARFGYEAVVIGDALFVSADHVSVEGRESVGVVVRYRRAGDGWRQVGRLAPEDPAEQMWFGHRIDGVDGTLAVAAPHDSDAADDAGSVYVFGRTNGSWSQREKLIDVQKRSEANFGHDIAMRGNRLMVGMMDQKDVLVFGQQDGSWGQIDTVTASDAEPSNWFGFRLAMLPDSPVVAAEPRSDGGGRLRIYGID